MSKKADDTIGEATRLLKRVNKHFKDSSRK